MARRSGYFPSWARAAIDAEPGPSARIRATLKDPAPGLLELAADLVARHKADGRLTIDATDLDEALDALAAKLEVKTSKAFAIAAVAAALDGVDVDAARAAIDAATDAARDAARAAALEEINKIAGLPADMAEQIASQIS